MVPSIECDIDFSAPGRQQSVIKVNTASGSWTTPIVVLANGSGPTLLLSGGVHGDEYEGPIALSKLARSQSPDDLGGRLIIIPFLNMPALRAAARQSPDDGQDMNRIFPGRTDGTASEILAYWICTNLVPLVDAVLDCHTGGLSTRWVPLAMMHALDGHEGQQARNLAFLRALKAPIGLVLNETDKQGMFDTFVEQQGKLFVCCEFGGGMVTPETLSVAEVCIRNALRHFEMIDGEAEIPRGSVWDEPRMMYMNELSSAVFAPFSGLYEPLEDVGTWVRQGQSLAVLHPLGLETEPVSIAAPADGLLFYRRASARVNEAQRLVMVGRDLDR